MISAKGCFYFCLFTFYFLNLFLNLPSRSRRHRRHSLTAFSRSRGELAGLKLSQVEVASRRHISAKKRVRKSSLESKSINSSIEFRAISRRLFIKSRRFINEISNRMDRIRK